MATIYDVLGKSPTSVWCPSRDVAGNGTTTLTDLVGGNSGTLTNMDPATDWPDDTGGGGIRALDFDGANDRVIVPDADNLSFGNGTNDAPFSISFWMNPASVAGSSPVAKASAATAGEWYVFLGADGRIFLRLTRNSNGGNIGRMTDAATYTTGWQHVLCSYDGSTSPAGIRIYLDNQRVDSADASIFPAGYTAMENTTQPVTIGSRGSGNFYPGRLDDIRLFPQNLGINDLDYLWADGEGRGRVTGRNMAMMRRRRQSTGGGL